MKSQSQRKSQRKRIISLISLLIVAVMLMTSCGSNDKKTSKTGDKSVKTITWLVPGDKQNGQDAVMEEVNKIVMEKLNAKLDIQFIDAGAFTERMTMKMASSEDFDLCFTGFVNNYAQAAENGGLLEIDELLNTVPALKKSISDVVWDASRYKGKIYAVPNLQIMTSIVSLQFRKDLVDKYNFDVNSVKHVNDIEPFLKAVKDGEKGIYPFRTNYGITPWITDKYETINGDVAIDKKDGKTAILRYNTPEFKQGVDTMYEWFKKGYIRPDVASVTDDTQDYNAGKYAVSSQGWKPGIEAITKDALGYDVVYKKLNEPYVGIGSGTGTMIGISKKCKNPELAIKFIELVNTDKDLYNLICFGKKDVNYTLTADNKVKSIEGSGYAPKADWKFGNQFNAMLLENQEDGVWEETMKVNNESLPSPVIGFSLSTENIINEISQCSTVSAEYKVLNCGAKDPKSYYDEFVSKMSVAGAEKILAETQSQLDAFWNAKSK